VQREQVYILGMRNLTNNSEVIIYGT
jgi:hypothetical protein